MLKRFSLFTILYSFPLIVFGIWASLAQSDGGAETCFSGIPMAIHLLPFYGGVILLFLGMIAFITAQFCRGTLILKRISILCLMCPFVGLVVSMLHGWELYNHSGHRYDLDFIPPGWTFVIIIFMGSCLFYLGMIISAFAIESEDSKEQSAEPGA